MTSECQDRKLVVRTLRSLHACPVENPVFPGTPDIAFIGGWIEMKHLNKWPTSIDTKVRIPHFTIQQRAWLRVHTHYGGNCYVIIVCGKEWLLLRGGFAAENIGQLTREQLVENSILHKTDGPFGDQLTEILKD